MIFSVASFVTLIACQLPKLDEQTTKLEPDAYGIPTVVVGAVLWRTYHRFALRWLVLVPAGVVVHDPVVLGETLMVLRPAVAGARLAPADTGAADLTGPAAGFAIEVSVHEAATVLFVKRSMASGLRSEAMSK